ncbi:chlorophyllase/cutinase-like alpha/beta fold protein [Pedobacter jeongneungensis]
MAIIKKIRSIFKRITDFLSPSDHLPGTAGKLIIAFVVVFLSVMHFLYLYDHIPPLYLIAYLLFYIACGIVLSILCVWLLKLLKCIPSTYQVAIVFSYLAAFSFFHLPTTYGWLLILLIIILPVLVLTGLYQWKKGSLFPLKSPKRMLWFFILVISSAAFVAGLVILFGQGSKPQAVVNYKMKGNLPAVLTLPDPSIKGPYKPFFLTYGSGKDKWRREFGDRVNIKTSSINGSRLLTSWTGVSGKLRTMYFGFDQKSLPMNALVWYPREKKGPLPLVMIIHGNHVGQQASDPGYTFLGELLASRGYMVVSVDENFLNLSITDLDVFGGGLKNENAARAWLLLKHLELLRNWNKTPGNTFYKRLDMDKIAIIGHSRGGEAVTHAAVFNKLGHYPDDAREKFNFNFNIGAVVAIAPVDGQYKPGGTLTVAKDISFFVIQGALDMDMQTYGGLATLKRIQFSPGFSGFKAGLYLSAANHGQFNSVWGRRDDTGPGINRFNLKQLMEEEEQQKILCVYISSFLETTINGEAGYKPLFMDARFGRNWLPKKIYMNQFEPAGKTVLADFDEDVDVNSATVNGGRITTSGLREWKEQQNKFLWGMHITKAVYLGWDSVKHQNGFFSLNLTAPLSLSGKMLSFSLAGGKENTAGLLKPIDFTIVLEDNNKHKLSFPLSSCSVLQPQIAKNLSKFALLNDYPNSEAVPDFFYFDIARLMGNHTEFQMNNLKAIKFIFNKSRSGDIILDDLSLINKP